MWIALGLFLGLGFAELRSRISVSFDPKLPSMRQPERLLQFLVEPDPPVRNVVLYPLENADDLTQLATFDLRDEKTGAWTAQKTRVDIPVTDDHRTLQDYAGAMRRQGRLTAPVRGPGFRESYAMSTLIVVLAVLITTATGPRLADQLRAIRILRAEARTKRVAAAALAAQAAAPATSLTPPDAEEAHEFTETAPPLDAALPQPPEEPKDYSGQWYPVARGSKRRK
jgi:hypothetical protein